MKIDFSQPRFTGARFDEHTLPVDVARDLAAYEALIIELAKHLYRKDNPDRQRVPRGFAADFRLDIARIDPGSAMPALVLAGALGLSGGERDYFERARDLIAECVAASESALPKDFPKELLGYFNQLGRSLREGEALELPRHGRIDAARLTPEKRKRLVLAEDQFYERETSLTGYIEEVDFGNATFRLRLADKGQVTTPMPESFHNIARYYAGHPRHLVSITGIGAYDSADHLQKIVSVASLETYRNHAIWAKLDEISLLDDGWFEGGGQGPDIQSLAYVSQQMVKSYPEKLSLPQIFPTQDGNLLLEWAAAGEPSLDICLANMQASFHAFDSTGNDLEQDFVLTDDDGWQSLFVFLDKNIKVRQA
jgi:hypothetical protein